MTWGCSVEKGSECPKWLPGCHAKSVHAEGFIRMRPRRYFEKAAVYDINFDRRVFSQSRAVHTHAPSSDLPSAKWVLACHLSAVAVNNSVVYR